MPTLGSERIRLGQAHMLMRRFFEAGIKGSAQSFVPVGANTGFTLIEIIGVLLLLAILSSTAITYYSSLLDESKRRGAQNLVAAAQTQLSLEFARRAVAGLALDADAQNICEGVIIDSPDVAASIICTGNIGGDVSISANIEGQTVTGAWNSPLSDGT